MFPAIISLFVLCEIRSIFGLVPGPIISTSVSAWTSRLMSLLHIAVAHNWCHEGAQCLYSLFPFCCNILSSHLVLSHLSPAIYNYDARGEEELSLQIGDTVHILETYEGENSLTDDLRDLSRHDTLLLSAHLPIAFCRFYLPVQVNILAECLVYYVTLCFRLVL